VQWRELTVEAQTGDPGSMLELYRQALRVRRAEPALGQHPDTPMTWRPAPDGVLAFDRGDGLCCVANLSAGAVALPARSAVLLASGPLTDGLLLPPDTAVWLRRPQA
jgi:alpha-glucosidase